MKCIIKNQGLDLSLYLPVATSTITWQNYVAKPYENAAEEEGHCKHGAKLFGLHRKHVLFLFFFLK